MATLLNSIQSAQDLRRLTPAQLETLASEIREFLIQTLARTGGHLGPNLGVVELTMALHIAFQHAGGQDHHGRKPPGLRS